jgi:Protein of unknown function (DUF2630)
MADEQLSDRIERLVAEEHELFHRGDSEHGLEKGEHERLEAIRLELDQCWDLLRQRRALRSAGRDPESASARDQDTVEHYLQ